MASDPENTRVFILPESAPDPDIKSFLRLPHPKTARPSLFLPNDESHNLLELQAVSPPPEKRRSWFVQNSVVSDGKLHMLTPFDPVYLLAPLLANITQFIPYDDLFEKIEENIAGESSDNKSFDTAKLTDDLNKLSQLSSVQEALKRICDVQDVGVMTYRMNKEKLAIFLKTKTTMLAESDSFSNLTTIKRQLAKSNLGDEDSDPELVKQAHLKFAMDLISNYLNDENEALLSGTIDVSKYDEHMKNLLSEFANETVEGGNAKDKKDDEKSKKSNSTKKGSRGVEALKSVDTKNMKKLTSFFTKK